MPKELYEGGTCYLLPDKVPCVMFFYAFLGILFELPLYYFAIPSKDRRPELVVFIILINLITWPLSLAVSSVFPTNIIVTFLTVIFSGLAEGYALRFAYAKNLPLQRSLITGVVINLVAFIFIRLFVAMFAR